MKKFNRFEWNRSLVFLPIVLALGACQKGTPLSIVEPTTPTTASPTETNTPATPTAPATTDSSSLVLSAKISGLKKANAYKIDLSWNKELDTQHAWILRRKHSLENAVPLSIPTKSVREYADTEVVSKGSYLYELGFLENGAFLLQTKTEVTLPADLEISAPTIVTSIKGFNRVFLNKGADLINYDQRLEIEANEIYSDGAVIRSFAEESKAQPNTDGQTGGAIIIHAKRAFGNLVINASAQNGGDGSGGARGAIGPEGTLGKMWLLTDGSMPELQTTLRNTNAPADDFRWRLVYACKNPGESDGGAGGAGYRGEQGAKGGRGGNSSKVYVRIDEPTQFEVQIKKVAGNKGHGGPGGEGGPGGTGGRGNWDPHHICPEPKSGVQGPQGPRGPEGLDGVDGVVLPVCKKLNNSVEGECDKFYERDGFIF